MATMTTVATTATMTEQQQELYARQLIRLKATALALQLSFRDTGEAIELYDKEGLWSTHSKSDLANIRLGAA